MGWGLLVVFVLFPLFVLSLIVSGIVILVSGKGKRRAATRTILLLYGVGFGVLLTLLIALVIVGQILDPMKVGREDVLGTYRVDRTMFPGPQADWQHDHFELTILESDTVVLRSLDANGCWNEFRRPIEPLHGVHSYLWKFPVEGDTTAHHILSRTPTLHRQRWSFYYSFPSPRFGNVFFKKEE